MGGAGSTCSFYLSHQLQNQTELRATNAERAAFFLDAALAARRSSRTPSDQEARRNSHFLFTLHLLQERPGECVRPSCAGSASTHTFPRFSVFCCFCLRLI